MLTFTPIAKKTAPPRHKRAKDIPTNTLFQAGLSKGEQPKIFLRTFGDVVDLNNAQDTYGDNTMFYDIVELDGDLRFWERQ